MHTNEEKIIEEMEEGIQLMDENDLDVFDTDHTSFLDNGDIDAGNTLKSERDDDVIDMNAIATSDAKKIKSYCEECDKKNKKIKILEQKLQDYKKESKQLEASTEDEFDKIDSFTESVETVENPLPLKAKKRKKKNNDFMQKIIMMGIAILLMIAGGYYILQTGGEDTGNNKTSNALNGDYADYADINVESTKKSKSKNIKKEVIENIIADNPFKKEESQIVEKESTPRQQQTPPPLSKEEQSSMYSGEGNSPIENKLMDKEETFSEDISYVCRLKSEIKSGKYAYYVKKGDKFVINSKKNWVKVSEKNIVMNYSNLSNFVEFEKDKFLKTKMFTSCKPIVPAQIN